MIKRIKNRIKAIWKTLKDGFSFEYNNPLEEWCYAGEWFKFPRINFNIIKPYQKRSWNNAWCIEFISSNMGWKSKYGKLQFEYEPFIELTLFNNITFQIVLEVPKTNNAEPYAYWEGILYIMSCYDSNTKLPKYCDEKIMWKTYNHNIWGEYLEDGTIHYKYTILPYLNHRGFFLWNKAKGMYGAKKEAQP